MASNKVHGYAIVQHSGFGYGNKSEFARGLETRAVSKTQRKLVLALGGKVFDTYGEANNYAHEEMYAEAQGLVPKAPGNFSSHSLDGLLIYIPQRVKEQQ